MTTYNKTYYPATSTQAITITLASLASDATNKLAGRASAYVDNTTNLDVDHIVSGFIKLGTSPTAGTIDIYAYFPTQVASGTPSWPANLGGTDAGVTIASQNMKLSSVRWAVSMTTDATTGLVLPIPPFSIAALYAMGVMPPYWGLWVVHSTVAALDSTGGNHYIGYERVQVSNG